VVHAGSLAEAHQLLERDSSFSMVLCGVYFDESRMYDLLEHVRATRPYLPFVCCRLLDIEMPPIALKALQISVMARGASAFVDLPELSRRDAAAGEERFKQLIMAHLPGNRAGTDS
jgi:hypothetical protein